MTETILNVKGMSCAHCKAAVEGQLDKLSGVERSNADPELGVVEVVYDEDRIEAGRLVQAIEDAGYAVAS